VAPTPTGPFVDIGHPIEGVNGIDPSIFFDDNGEASLIWAAKGTALITRLKPNLVELAETPRRVEGATNFFEGPWLFKRQGQYYLTYPAFREGGVGRGGHGQNYGYAMASSLAGPWAYKGSFTESGPGGENIHGSQLEWNGKWYCFYHDFSTSKGKAYQEFKRNVRVDEMTFAADGSIKPLVWTSEGPAQLHNLNPYTTIDAGTMNATDPPEGEHPIAVDAADPAGVMLGPVLANSWIRYRKADFGAGARTFQVDAASATGGGVIEVHGDSHTGPLLASCKVSYTGGWRQFRTFECPATGASGVHDFVLVVRGEGAELLTLRSIRFAQ
jgi:arabinoxylan arabinofuranohydrolase